MKIAILVDGGYFLKRLGTVCPDIDSRDCVAVAKAIGKLTYGHLNSHQKMTGSPHVRSDLYRVFYYDAKPYLGKAQYPISKKPIDYAKSDEATFRLGLYEELRKSPNMAVRLGDVIRERSWVLREKAQKDILSKRRLIEDLTDEDFHPGLRQKAVDMRIGLDISSLTLKKQVDTIVLVAGDADFVPAAKLARREGVKIVLDPLWRTVSSDLFEHIDRLYSGFKRPRQNQDG